MPLYLEQIASAVEGEALKLGTLSIDDYIYLRGNDTTDGSVRIISPSSGVVIFEARVSGIWVNIGTFSP